MRFFRKKYLVNSLDIIFVYFVCLIEIDEFYMCLIVVINLGRVIVGIMLVFRNGRVVLWSGVRFIFEIFGGLYVEGGWNILRVEVIVFIVSVMKFYK